jgi:hypothetical protein
MGLDALSLDYHTIATFQVFDNPTTEGVLVKPGMMP